MRRTILAAALVVAVLLLLVALPSATRADAPAFGPSARPLASAHRSPYVPGELIVKFKAGLASTERTDALQAHGAGLERSLHVPRTALVSVPAGADVRSAARALERDPRVAWAQPNAYVQPAALPNDPFFAEEWGLHNAGQAVNGASGMVGADIHAPEAWDRTTGSPDVKVAVIDTGMTFGQPDLAPNIWHNPGETGGGRESNHVDDDGNGYVDDWRGWDVIQRDNDPTDYHGHGTHVAGTIAARGDNGVGVTGVAWRASIIPVRVFDNLEHGTCAGLADGAAYAVRVGARVANMSLGTDEPCQLLRDVIDGAPNTLFVVAAMNDGSDNDATPVYPCAYPSANLVCVAATDANDRLAGFSNYGGRSVDLAAPGVNVLSAWPKAGPRETIYTDGFEAPLAAWWSTGGTPNSWVRTPFAPLHGGGFALSNSVLGTYDNNTDNWARLNLNLTTRRNCVAFVWADVQLGDYDPSLPREDQDTLFAETSPDGVDWGGNVDSISGSDDAFYEWLISMDRLEGHSTGGLRFRLHSDASATFGGVALDDLHVDCAAPLTNYTGARDDFDFDEGTSMAAPHVTGVAVLLLALDPRLTATELKQRLLSTVDPLPSLAGKTVTGGRLNAARAVDLPTQAAASAPTGAQPPATPRRASRRARMASALAADLRAVARSLRSLRARTLLRRGGLGPVRLHALEAGRFTLTLRSASGKTIARGSCACKRAGHCALTARLTRRGRSLLRHSRRPRVTLALAFKPRSGAAVVRRTTLTLG
jgi:subtilisin family serine protease